MKDIKKVTLKKLRENGKVTSDKIAKLCKISRQAAHAHLFELAKEGKIIRIGKTRGAYYVLYSKEKTRELQKSEERYCARLKNKGLEQDDIYTEEIPFH